MNKKRKIFVILICFVILALLMVCAFYNGLVVNKHKLTTNKLNKEDSIRIVLITDLHSHIYGKNQSKLVSLIEKQKPDIIALAGDIVDDSVPIEGAKQFLIGIEGLAPTFYVSGNHEYWSNDIRNIKALFRKYNVNVLENNYQNINIRNSNLIIGGVEDPEIMRYEYTNLNYSEIFHNSFSELKDKSQYKILLAHRPEFIELYKESYFDLVLSGHAHGGQVRIPFIINGLFAPNQGWLPKFAGGKYQHDSLVHVVSRGISFNPRLPRIFNPPEVVVIDIEGE
ncbi:metallophosphoesterase [Ruminiclostridium herbifermentans]|uniref:Metallophosphoesterase n=1 Tax=Ruminiclostridium herbifermentans TaxID=2488810 RepID=A0A4V6EP69_9FIRM|nr:metallophosphoesterase [Ruminiclostridium herbifermentans]QNU65410.1 metallophosphoesterase [Ruminiclostridium herbifermentans]